MSFESLIWVVPLIVLAAGAWRPRFGVVTLAAALPLFGSPPGGPYLGALDVAALIAILTSMRAAKRHYPGEPDWRHSGVEWPVAAWLAVSVASMVPLIHYPPAWTPSAVAGLLTVLPDAQSGLPIYTWRALANLMLGLGLFFAVRRCFAGRSVQPLAYGLGAGVGVVLLLGLGEFAGLFGLGAYRVVGDPLYEGRLHAIFFHSAWLAEYLVLAIPFAAAALLRGTRQLRVAGLALVGLGLLAIVFTQQRGAWVAVLAQAAALPFVFSRGAGRELRWRRIAVALLVAVLMAAGAIGYLRPDLAAPVIERVESMSKDLSGRPALWGAAAELTKERPMLGWGLGSFATAYDEIHPRWSQQSWRYRGTAHSLYFHTLAERGLLGLLALLSLGWALFRGLRESQSMSHSRYRGIDRGLTVSLVGLTAYGLVQYVMYLKSIELLVWMLIGVASLVMAGTPQGTARRLAQVACVVALVLLPWRWLTVEPLETRLGRAYGFHELEKQSSGRALRWSEGRAMIRLPRQGDVLSFEIADGHPKHLERDVDLVVRVDGRELWSGPAPGSWREIRAEIGDTGRDFVTLTLHVKPTFRPAFDYRKYEDLEASRDIRRLGIAISNLSWEK